MIIGVTTEVKPDERRVAMTPAGAAAFRSHGHEVLIERGAGAGSGFADRDYRAAGARVLDSASPVWKRADLILKVKEPQAAEYRFLRPGLCLFTYLHLAASPRSLTLELMRRRVSTIGYETVQLEDSTLPLLAPMSEVAGRLAIQAGAWCLESRNGGRGVLLSGASGVRPARVVILGAGIAGANACRVAAGVGAEVTLMDVNPSRLRYLNDLMGGHVTTVMSNRATVEEELLRADLVVGSVLVPGARTPRLISTRMVRKMKRGAAIVDLSIDQGGVAQTSRPTTHAHPTFVAEGVVHYCVSNMPGAVPHTSTYALTNATLSYALEIADHGLLGASSRNRAIAAGLNTYEGKVVHPVVAEALGLEASPPPWE